MKTLPDSFKRLFNEPISVDLLDRDGNIVNMEFLPLDSVQFTLYSDISSKTYELFEKKKKELNVKELTSEQQGVIAMNPEILEKSIELIASILQKAYSVDDDIAKQFAVDNLPQMIQIIEKLSPVADKSAKSEALKKIQQLQLKK